jgi:hypothetical protein
VVNNEWTIQNNRQHWTDDTDGSQTQNKSRTQQQQNKQHGPNVNPCASEEYGKQLMFLIRSPP